MNRSVGVRFAQRTAAPPAVMRSIMGCSIRNAHRATGMVA